MPWFRSNFPRRFVRACAFAALTAVLCAGLLSAAVLASAPFMVVPLIVAVCVGMPMVATWALYDAAAATGVRAEMSTMSRQDRRAIEQLRRKLAHLPETDHPLGC